MDKQTVHLIRLFPVKSVRTKRSEGFNFFIDNAELWSFCIQLGFAGDHISMTQILRNVNVTFDNEILTIYTTHIYGKNGIFWFYDRM